MSSPSLQQYLARLPHKPQADAKIWLDAAGRAQGRFLHAALCSAFQPVRLLHSGQSIGFEALARSHAEREPGLCLWNLLDRAASDAESVELDRLCRMLHAINFFRQPQSSGRLLYLHVHARLLAAVEANHGVAFRRVLQALDLPHERIVLQLPLMPQEQGWLLDYVADNYRRNGFRLALSAANAQQALDLLDLVHIEEIKLDARELTDETAALRLLLAAQKRGVRVIFKRVENDKVAQSLRHLGEVTGQDIYAQGFLWDIPQSTLTTMPPFASNAAATGAALQTTEAI